MYVPYLRDYRGLCGLSLGSEHQRYDTMVFALPEKLRTHLMTFDGVDAAPSRLVGGDKPMRSTIFSLGMRNEQAGAGRGNRSLYCGKKLLRTNGDREN